MTDRAARPPRGLARIKRWAIRLIYSRHAFWGLGIASFLESILIPIPLEVILVPLMQARRSQIFLLSTIALLGCLAGATVGYFVGYFVFDAAGQLLVEMVSTPEQFEHVRMRMEGDGFWFIMSVGVIPIPFQIAMLAAGATRYSFFLFMLASALSRALRYYGLGMLVLIAGNHAQAIFERHKVSAAIVVTTVVLVIWAAVLLGG
ncbi:MULTISPECIES: YqaA family protein [unclassified Marinobacter]|uniref:YqaA family protein n=1 Tax=unclassified Marinobacter TaxID=83889 RepID=UPI000BF8BD60|nr:MULTISPECIES: VTT domain-containing protein [unclassified Marinobacter]PFG09750.1 membrane protein YqaA with SNARE-associated domain [Marinobacter sp. LV10MA510-1]PFG51680.1 membrane protein YqaA with SNARE-associated domain [Marinobacter sp. LV10R520-4]